jgi:hypothetical protein
MANSGVVVVTELRKFVNGVDTGQTKPNVVGDPDYVAPYLGIQTCLPNTDPVTTTTSTSTTTTTTGVSLNPFSLSNYTFNSTIEACNHTDDPNAHTNFYFSGQNSTPAVNDTFYFDSAGQILLPAGIYHSPTTSSALTINSSGVLTSIFACSAPAAKTTTTTTAATTTTSTTTTTTIAVADYSCGDGYRQVNTSNNSYGNYPSVSVSSSDPTGNTFYWEALDRPNRFNVYENGSLLATSGWVGNANYFGPWGSSLSTSSTGTFNFNWTAGSTNREVRVEFGGSDPANQIGDGANWQIQCAAPTTTTTTTTQSQPALWLLQGCDTGQGSQTIPYDSNLDVGVVILASDAQCYTVMSTLSFGQPTLSWVSEFTNCNECNPNQDF